MTNFKLDTGAGDSFSRVAEKAKAISENKNRIVEFEFNGVNCLVNKTTNLDWLYRDYSNSWTMEWKTVGPICVEEYDTETKSILFGRRKADEEKQQERTKELEKRDAQQKEKADAIIDGVVLQIITGKEKEYEEYVAKNSVDGYSRGVVDYAEYWAKLMQVEIGKGNAIAEIAEDSQKHLSFLGITGFMYGCAVSALAHFWVHGEELRKWHNKEYGVKEDNGGVVNPAIFTIG